MSNTRNDWKVTVWKETGETGVSFEVEKRLTGSGLPEVVVSGLAADLAEAVKLALTALNGDGR